MIPKQNILKYTEKIIEYNIQDIIANLSKKQREKADEEIEKKFCTQERKRWRIIIPLFLKEKTYEQICSMEIILTRRGEPMQSGSLKDYGNRVLKKISFLLTDYEKVIDKTNIHIKIPELMYLKTEVDDYIQDENEINKQKKYQILEKVNFQPNNSEYKEYHISPYINTFVAERDSKKYFIREFSLQKPLNRNQPSNEEIYTRSQQTTNILNQIKISFLLKNSFPKLVESFKNGEKFYIVYEFFIGKPLSNFIPYKEEFADLFEQKDAIAILKNMLEAVDRLHSINIVHRMIHPRTVYINDRNEVTLINFEYAKNIDRNMTELEQGTTAIPGGEYLPLCLSGFTDRSVDFFSIALIFLRMVTGIETRQFRTIDRESREPSYFLNRKLSPLEKVLKRMIYCVSKNSYQSAREVLDDLEQAI